MNEYIHEYSGEVPFGSKRNDCNYGDDNEFIDFPAECSEKQKQRARDNFRKQKRLKDLLSEGQEIGNDREGMIKWLKKTGHKKINVKGRKDSVGLENAPYGNIARMYGRIYRSKRDELFKLREGHYPYSITG